MEKKDIIYFVITTMATPRFRTTNCLCHLFYLRASPAVRDTSGRLGITTHVM
ncbi:hypothetical protein AZA_25789 [Nitrospirillum viridazoti Y2]|nr:hypothetical protein AZA_25789 [Nitrospirillum amazonense Y2]